MTAPRISRTGRRGWTRAHRDLLAHGHDWHGAAWGDGRTILDFQHVRFTTLDSIPPDVLAEMGAAWSTLGTEIDAELAEKQPGKRAWFRWLVELVPVEPLRVVDDERFDDEEQFHLRAPDNFYPWQAERGVESSFSYLWRRRLLQPGELERLRVQQSAEHQSAAWELAHARQYRHNRPQLSAHALACIAMILGDDVLTDDERDLAAGELSLLRSYGEPTQ